MATKKNSDLKGSLMSSGKSLSDLVYDKEKPTSVYSEAVTSDDDEANKENSYLRATDVHIPFSTNLRADLYLMLKRIEYHDADTSVREIIEKALEEYVRTNPLAQKPLSEKARKKLKPIKTTYDYRVELKGRKK